MITSAEAATPIGWRELATTATARGADGSGGGDEVARGDDEMRRRDFDAIDGDECDDDDADVGRRRSRRVVTSW